MGNGVDVKRIFKKLFQLSLETYSWEGRIFLIFRSIEIGIGACEFLDKSFARFKKNRRSSKDALYMRKH